MEVVIDPKGVVAGGRSYPAGTPLTEVRATAADVAAWRRFGQIGEAETPAAPVAGSRPKRSKQRG